MIARPRHDHTPAPGSLVTTAGRLVVAGARAHEYPLYGRCVGCRVDIVAMDGSAEWGDLAEMQRYHPELARPETPGP